MRVCLCVLSERVCVSVLRALCLPDILSLSEAGLVPARSAKLPTPTLPAPTHTSTQATPTVVPHGVRTPRHERQVPSIEPGAIAAEQTEAKTPTESETTITASATPAPLPPPRASRLAVRVRASKPTPLRFADAPKGIHVRNAFDTLLSVQD